MSCNSSGVNIELSPVLDYYLSDSEDTGYNRVPLSLLRDLSIEWGDGIVFNLPTLQIINMAEIAK